ncbi:MAG: phosphoribosylformylglycinamidine cyclo-ligase [Bacteroidales bacterium]|nr:phosphoribosylformylglycinamidine cyclo-ligase [Bacteroidales bacterium]MBP5517426.1 phosphoribosylformylglycinamidine cyclo-ligase [Bacteroidales bacterium]MBP5692423.1 phosphoribosylformylglycinamidine cyclo-ligase [Bacteroidales bacterium]
MAKEGSITDRYAQRGVSSQKEDVHKAIKNVDKGLFPKAFCKIVEDVYSKEEDPWCSVMHADGAGTKSSLAYAYWKETGDLSVWDGIAQDAIVMNTDDLLCVGITDNIYISSTIGRNKALVPGEVIERLISGSEKFVAKMKEFGVNLIPTGGETADVGDLVRTIIADTTVYAKIRKSQVIDNANIRPGDVIVGLASDGQAKYEDFYNGGMGSNGLTSARHDVFAKYLGLKYPETYDQLIPEALVYSGTKKLTDIEPETGLTYGRLVLSPTRTYAPVVKVVLDKMRDCIHGMIHCTGGAQTKILHFVGDLRIVKDNLFPVPVLFRTIQQESGTPWKEMFKVFNMGHRMEFYTGEREASEIIAISESFGIPARVIGRVEKGGSGLPALTVSCPQGEFNY